MPALASTATAASAPRTRRFQVTGVRSPGVRAISESNEDGDGSGMTGTTRDGSVPYPSSPPTSEGGGAPSGVSTGGSAPHSSVGQGGSVSLPTGNHGGASASHTTNESGFVGGMSSPSSSILGGQSSTTNTSGNRSNGDSQSISHGDGDVPTSSSSHFQVSTALAALSPNSGDRGGGAASATAAASYTTPSDYAPGDGLSHTTITTTEPPASTGSVHQTTYTTIYTTPTASKPETTTVITSTSTPPPDSTHESSRSTYYVPTPSSSYATTDIVTSTSTPAFAPASSSDTNTSARSVVTSVHQITITRSLDNNGDTPSYTVTTSSSTMYAAAAATGKSTGFFANHGAVGGTFAVVGIVAVALLGLLAWLVVRKRKQRQMDADIVAATTAGAATTRQPFADDDDDHDYALETDNDNMQQVGHAHSSSFPTGDYSSQGGTAHRSPGPYREFNTFGAGTGAAEYPPASLYDHEEAGQYEHPYYPSSGHGSFAAALAPAAATTGGVGMPSNGQLNYGEEFHTPSAEEAYRTPSEYLVYGAYPPAHASAPYSGHFPGQASCSLPYGGDPALAHVYGEQQVSHNTHDVHPLGTMGAINSQPSPLTSPFAGTHQLSTSQSPGGAAPGFVGTQPSSPPLRMSSGPNETNTLASPNPSATATHAFYSEHPAADGEDSLTKAHSLSRSGYGL